MSLAETLVVALTIIAIIALTVWFFVGRHPEQGEGRQAVRPDTRSDRFYSTADRPAGPDAEDAVIERPPIDEESTWSSR